MIRLYTVQYWRDAARRGNRQVCEFWSEPLLTPEQTLSRIIKELNARPERAHRGKRVAPWPPVDACRKLAAKRWRLAGPTVGVAYGEWQPLYKGKPSLLVVHGRPYPISTGCY